MNDDFSFDKSSLREVILSYLTDGPKEGRKFAQHIDLPDKEYSNLIVSGMGGSALQFDLLIGQLNHEKQSFKMPVIVARSAIVIISLLDDLLRVNQL